MYPKARQIYGYFGNSLPSYYEWNILYVVLLSYYVISIIIILNRKNSENKDSNIGLLLIRSTKSLKFD